MSSWSAIEAGIEGFLEILRRDERVLREFEASRAEFFSEPGSARAPWAELRLLEWFLLERPSAVLCVVPARAWHAEWLATISGATPELGTSLLQSLPGAFEVTSLAPAAGFWVRDLFAQGEHPVVEARAAHALAVGDLLVGRLFPLAGGVFLPSPTVSVFRNPALVAAVRSDLGAMRAARRGVLRVQQLELERLFHGAGPTVGVPRVPADVRARVREELLALGLEASAVGGILEQVKRAARAAKGGAVTEILSALAFETEVDLSSARLVLSELWDIERGASAQATEPERAKEELNPRAALAAFDCGRAAGKDMEQLFRALERDLGLEDEEQSAEQEELGAPDFPGVVAAIVEEFLWELEREEGPERARSWAVLRELGTCCRDIGVFEELDAARLLDFSARWLLDESQLRQVTAVEALLDALAAFCQWCQERHDLPLWKTFGDTLGLLRVSVPRHAQLRQHTSADLAARVYWVIQLKPGCLLVRDRDGSEHTIEVTPVQAGLVRGGDLVRVKQVGDAVSLAGGYPAELGTLLS